jgi:hypothetical protein
MSNFEQLYRSRTYPQWCIQSNHYGEEVPLHLSPFILFYGDTVIQSIRMKQRLLPTTLQRSLTCLLFRLRQLGGPLLWNAVSECGFRLVSAALCH